jgi:serine/threonine-protein kinase HipA
MTPAYDLLNTRLHLPGESACALDLFENDYETESFKANGFYARDDFHEFGTCIGILQNRTNRFLDTIAECEIEMSRMIDISYLSKPIQSQYKELIKERIKALTYSYTGKHG